MHAAIFIVGPTGSGKSEVALLVAKKLGGEIISCDSMQMYRGLDIGTAKPTRKEQKQVPHHLIDVLHPKTRASVFRHRRLAEQALRRIFKKGKIPILTGGSGFYVRALTDGIPNSPGGASKPRRALETRAKKQGPGPLYERLKQIDLKRAHAIHPNDTKRIIRALEVYELSKRKPSEFGNGTSGLKKAGMRFFIFGLKRERKELYRRIARRVDRMLAQGWVREVKRLKPGGFSRTAREAIGYREILEYMNGKKDFETTVSEIKKRTRHLAKKQLSWFRSDKRIRWIPVRGDRFQKSAVQKILKHYAA